MKRFLLAAAISVGLTGVALAQTGSQYNAKLSIAPVQNLPLGALVPVSPASPQAQTLPAPVGLVGSILNEQIVVPSSYTAFAITPNNNTTLLFLNSTTTETALTVTFPALPSDGSNFCWLNTNTTTAVTMTANTGQTVVGTAVTAGVAGTSYCWRWIGVTATWYRTL